MLKETKLLVAQTCRARIAELDAILSGEGHLNKPLSEIRYEIQKLEEAIQELESPWNGDEGH